LIGFAEIAEHTQRGLAAVESIFDKLTSAILLAADNRRDRLAAAAMDRAAELRQLLFALVKAKSSRCARVNNELMAFDCGRISAACGTKLPFRDVLDLAGTGGKPDMAGTVDFGSD
jgi:hypothetical protein